MNPEELVDRLPTIRADGTERAVQAEEVAEAIACGRGYRGLGSVTSLMALSTCRSISRRLPVPGTMSSKICPAAACLRGQLQAGYLMPGLASARTFPTVILGS